MAQEREAQGVQGEVDAQGLVVTDLQKRKMTSQTLWLGKGLTCEVYLFHFLWASSTVQCLRMRLQTNMDGLMWCKGDCQRHELFSCLVFFVKHRICLPRVGKVRKVQGKRQGLCTI